MVEILRRRWAVVLACLVVVPVAAYGYTRLQKPEYTATASVLLNDPATTAGIAGTQAASAASSDESTLLSTDLSVASLQQVSAGAAKELGGSYAQSGLPGSVAAGNDGVSNLLTMSATESSPKLAALVANAYARSYMAFQTRASVAAIRQERADITAQIARLQSGHQTGQKAQIAQLEQQSGQLETLAALQNGNQQLVAAATPPTTPSSPKTVATVIAGGALGLLLGLLLAGLFTVLDRRLRDPSDVTTALSGPVLGAIPKSYSLSSKRRGSRMPVGALESESFAMIHTNISHYNRDTPVRSVVVTSASGGDGKSTIAWNLAVAGARAGRSVLFVEADLRHPTMAERLGVEPRFGLRDLLVSEKFATGECINRVTFDANGTVNGMNYNNGEHSAVDVLFASHAGTNGWSGPMPGAVIGSDRMCALITEAEDDYDLVLIDTPPSQVVADAVPLFNQVSGVVLVMRLRKNTREDARQLQLQLNHLSARTLGVVVNAVDSTDRYYDRAVSAYLRRPRSMVGR